MRRGWCLNLFGLLLVREPATLDAVLLNHELIHTAQQRELLFVPFYLLYGLEWALRYLLCFSASRAYHAVSFEREAYDHARDLSYLARRCHFAWLRDVFRR